MSASSNAGRIDEELVCIDALMQRLNEIHYSRIRAWQ